jgi:hypothetical protein
MLICTTLAGNQTRILIVGDSWGTVSPATEFFQKELAEHNCDPGFEGFTNIAVGGTTAKQWASPIFLPKVKKQAPTHDLIWITLGGNDALANCPLCAAEGKSAEECADELITKANGWVGTILDAIHEANPDAQVVGFGYDIMFGGLGCEVITRDVFPQCWNNQTAGLSPIRCFNNQFIKIQQVWEGFAASRPYVHALNLLGTSQVAGGDRGVTVGNPNLDKFGPAKYWPDTLACIHPSTDGGEDSGAMVIMREFYKQYWSKVLNC